MDPDPNKINSRLRILIKTFRIYYAGMHKSDLGVAPLETLDSCWRGPAGEQLTKGFHQLSLNIPRRGANIRHTIRNTKIGGFSTWYLYFNIKNISKRTKRIEMGVVIYPFFAILENQHISIDQVPYI